MEVADGIATFPNGLKLRLTLGQLSQTVIYDACNLVREPDVPQAYIESRGVFEENPDDPDYRTRMAQAKERRAWAAVKTLVLMGTEFHATPTGVPGPEDVNWRRVAKQRQEPVPDDEDERYYLWVKDFAFTRYPSTREGLEAWLSLTQFLALEAGITMEAPSAIVATFRDEAGRAADPAGGTLAATGDGDVGGHAAVNRSGY